MKTRENTLMKLIETLFFRPCDSDSLQHYADFTELSKKKDLDKNFTDWKIIFPRREPVERLIDHFMDHCVR